MNLLLAWALTSSVLIVVVLALLLIRLVYDLAVG